METNSYQTVQSTPKELARLNRSLQIIIYSTRFRNLRSSMKKVWCHRFQKKQSSNQGATLCIHHISNRTLNYRTWATTNSRCSQVQEPLQRDRKEAWCTGNNRSNSSDSQLQLALTEWTQQEVVKVRTRRLSPSTIPSTSIRMQWIEMWTCLIFSTVMIRISIRLDQRE